MELRDMLSPDPISLPTPEQVKVLVLRLRQDSSEFRIAFDQYGQASPALRKVGLAFWASGNLDKAAQLILAALSLEDTSAPLWKDIAGIYSAGGHFTKAVFCAERSSELDPGRAQTWILLASALEKMERYHDAISAYDMALVLEPTSAVAYFGIGIIHLKSGDIPAALGALRRTVANDPGNAFARICLGHAHYNVGEFQDCVAVLEEAMALEPLDDASRETYIKAKACRDIIAGNVDEALAAHPDSSLVDRRAVLDSSRELFSLLNVFGYHDAAHAVGQYRVRLDPRDDVQLYMNASVSGVKLDTAPVEYVAKHFDEMAANFDAKLVQSLGYNGPSIMAAMVKKYRQQFRRILDLGCGTGLAADAIHAFGGELLGVDLSEAMLRKAEERKLYNQLVKAEGVGYLESALGSFDLIFAADVLIYVGALERFFAAASDALLDDGLLAVSFETLDKPNYELRPSGRFAHSRGYVEGLTSGRFTMLEWQEGTLRTEMRMPLNGAYAVFQKRTPQ